MKATVAAAIQRRVTHALEPGNLLLEDIRGTVPITDANGDFRGVRVGFQEILIPKVSGGKGFRDSSYSLGFTLIWVRKEDACIFGGGRHYMKGKVVSAQNIDKM